jgi:hypothetical protein
MGFFRSFLVFLRFWLISYAAQEKLSIIRIIRKIIRIMPKLSVIQIKLFLIRTNTPTLHCVIVSVCAIQSLLAPKKCSDSILTRVLGIQILTKIWKKTR